MTGITVSAEASVNALGDVAMSSVGGFDIINLSGGLWHSHGTLSVSSIGAISNRTSSTSSTLLWRSFLDLFLTQAPPSPPRTTHHSSRTHHTHKAVILYGGTFITDSQVTLQGVGLGAGALVGSFDGGASPRLTRTPNAQSFSDWVQPGSRTVHS